jgi:DNA helicase-2/ATP-dependent DNA helicase PcrA
MNSTAILARTNRATREVEAALGAANIPYYLLNRCGFWQQIEIKSGLAFCGASLYPADHLIAGMLHSPFWPVKYLPKSKLLPRLKELQTDKQPSYWHLLTQEPRSLVEEKNLKSVSEFTQFVHSLSRYKDLSAGEAVKQILLALRAWDFYANVDEIDNSPVENLTELVKIASRFQTLREFLDYARKVSAVSKRKTGVAVGTVHSGKGLEWQRVFLIGCQAGLMPHEKATDLDEERSIFFVACSRAERELHISYSGQPSPFLKSVVQCKEKESACPTGS